MTPEPEPQHQPPAIDRLRARTRAWLQLTRLSNLPTVWTNTLAGAAAAAAGTQADWIAWRGPVVAGVVASLLYAAGMALNDVMDAPRDALDRPERPIPSRRIARRTAIVFIAACFLIALVLAASLSPAALGTTTLLITSIVLYDWLHGARAPAAVFMGLNRALVYLLAATSLAPEADALTPALQPAAWLAGATGCYTILLTLIARAEASGAPSPIARLAWALPLIPLAALPGIPAAAPWLAALLALPMLAWIGRGARLATRSPARTKPAVLRWLSGFCLIDTFYLALLDRPILFAIALACFALTVLAHRRILGT